MQTWFEPGPARWELANTILRGETAEKTAEKSTRWPLESELRLFSATPVLDAKRLKSAYGLRISHESFTNHGTTSNRTSCCPG